MNFHSVCRCCNWKVDCNDTNLSLYAIKLIYFAPFKYIKYFLFISVLSSSDILVRIVVRAQVETFPSHSRLTSTDQTNILYIPCSVKTYCIILSPHISCAVIPNINITLAFHRFSTSLILESINT